jgi:hypothetical protein
MRRGTDQVVALLLLDILLTGENGALITDGQRILRVFSPVRGGLAGFRHSQLSIISATQISCNAHDGFLFSYPDGLIMHRAGRYYGPDRA